MTDFVTPNIKSPSVSDLESARIALGQIHTWAQWMAAIQTAAIGGLGQLALRKSGLPVGARPWAIAAFLFLALALYFSAWVLTAIPSINIRLGRLANAPGPSQEFDIHHWPSFTWPGGQVSLGTLMGLQHWCWGLGLGCFGVVAVLRIVVSS